MAFNKIIQLSVGADWFAPSADDEL